MNAYRLGERINKLFVHLIFILLGLFCVIPILYIISASLTTEEAIAEFGYTLFPKVFSTQAYDYIFQSPGAIVKAYGVTIFVTAAGTTISLICTSMLGYVISRRDFPLHRQISFIIFFAMLFNGGMVPSYILITRYYHLKNTILVMILPYVLSVWNVFLMKGFFTDIPTSLLEAAKLDGCTELQVFTKIVVPISKPAFATVGLFTAFSYWNDWWLSMMYTIDDKFTSLQYYLYRIMNSITFLNSSMADVVVNLDRGNLPSETARMALCVLAAGPMLVIFPFFQKYFVKGLTVGSVKG